MTHILPPLPFAKDALAPHISAETIEYHYGKHHKGYVDKLNKLIVGTPFENTSLEETVLKSSGLIFNNAGQAWNHDFYWKSLTPRPMQPGSVLLAAIDNGFGSIEAFQKLFNEAAVSLFGSGWAWMVLTGTGSIEIRQTPNAENPLHQKEIPLLVCDVWEHAYYIDYRNERAKYVSSIWNILNWEFAEANLALAKQKAA